MDFSRVGGVEAVGGAFRACVQWKEKGVRRHSHGPRRAERQIAQADLESMRSAASGLGRDEGFAAIRRKSLLLSEEKPTAQKGFVEQTVEGFRARVQWIEEGANRHAHGPRRGEKRRAEEDLESLRGAAEEKDMTRSEGHQAILEEAARLQRRAEYETRIRITSQQLAASQAQQSPPLPPQPAEHDASDDSSDWYEGDPYAGDDTPPWEKIEKAMERGEEIHTAPPQFSGLPDPKTADEATAMLANFRAPRNTPESLERLLERRADPNIHLGIGHISPLENIIHFARAVHAEQMRYLLLDYGAVNTAALEREWIIRRSADAHEERRLARLRDPRPLL